MRSNEVGRPLWAGPGMVPVPHLMGGITRYAGTVANTG